MKQLTGTSEFVSLHGIFNGLLCRTFVVHRLDTHQMSKHNIVGSNN